MNELKKEPACEEKTYVVYPHQLPLSCPTATMDVWNAHPRVYLPIDRTGQETCPYCGAHYILKHD